MNDKNIQNEQLESLLRRARMPELSPELKERITAEATKAWNQTSPELPWQIPIRRLIVSAAAAVFVIWLTNCSTVAHQQPLDLDVLPEIPYGPLARHLVSTGRKPSLTDVSVLRNYTETVRRILDEAQQNGVSKPPASSEDRSLLLPTQPDFNSYS